MRHKINHEWPDDVQPMPEDNTAPYVWVQVVHWVRFGKLIHPQSAMEIAAWWHGPTGYAEDFSAFSHTGTITGDLLAAIDSKIPQYVGKLQEWFSVPAAYASDDHPADNLNALHALRAYVLAVPHADCPHEPGRLYDCPACAVQCFCGDLNTETECVHCAE